MPIVKITTQLRGCQRMTYGGVPFENGMSVEIMDPDLHPKSGKNYFNTSNVEKARAFDPFGHAGFDPSGKIRMTP